MILEGLEQPGNQAAGGEEPGLAAACAMVILRWHEAFGRRLVGAEPRYPHYQRYLAAMDRLAGADPLVPAVQQDLARQQLLGDLEWSALQPVPGILWRACTHSLGVEAPPPETLGDAARWILRRRGLAGFRGTP